MSSRAIFTYNPAYLHKSCIRRSEMPHFSLASFAVTKTHYQKQSADDYWLISFW